MLVYVCSRYRADNKEQFEKQLEITKGVSRVLVRSGHDVIVPHLYYPNFLDDNNEAERIVGIESAIRLMEKCDIVVSYIGLGVSKGMEAELERARQIGKTIYHFENMNILKDILKRIDLHQEMKELGVLQ